MLKPLARGITFICAAAYGAGLVKDMPLLFMGIMAGIVGFCAYIGWDDYN